MSDDHATPHLPHGSIWPFWLALGVAAFGMGAIFKDLLGGVFPFLMLILLILPLIGWFREDYKWWWTNTGTGTHIPRAGTLMFIGSEIFLFGGLFATYFTFKSQATQWPDPNSMGEVVHLDHMLPLVAIFTLFLFSSSFTIHKAEHNLKAGNHKAFQKWWLATIVLGLIFLAGQVNEYMNLIAEHQTLAGGSQYMAAFYMITGTHGLHVLGGLVFLVIVYLRARKGQFTPERHAAPETASLYWHFVDLVWVIVLTLLYIVPVYL